MADEERRRRACDILDDIHDPINGPLVLLRRLEDLAELDGRIVSQREYLTLPQIWKEIASLYD